VKNEEKIKNFTEGNEGNEGREENLNHGGTRLREATAPRHAEARSFGEEKTGVCREFCAGSPRIIPSTPVSEEYTEEVMDSSLLFLF